MLGGGSDSISREVIESKGVGSFKCCCHICGAVVLMKTIGGGWQNFLFTALRPKRFMNLHVILAQGP